MAKIARITELPLREVWPHEARDFSRWLAENLDYLEEIVGLHLTLVEREAPTGDFAVDILAEDGEGNLVVIENQLGATDHDHLGKLVTYMANHGAKVAIWVTGWPRPEHEKAVLWLNEVLPADTAVYLLQVRAVRIEDSPPAPLFTLVAGPSPEGRQVGLQRKELAERHLLRLQFWEQLLQKAGEARSDHPHARVSPSKQNWLNAGAGKSGVSWAYVVFMDHAQVELYINTQDPEENKRIFDALFQHKEEIEKAFGAPLVWQRLDGKRAARVAYPIYGQGGLRDRERWPELQQAMVEAMFRLEGALKPFLAQIL